MRDNFARSTVRGVLALVLALLLPFSARAADKDEIRNYIIVINHLYESLDYELALSRVPLARKLPLETDEEVTLSLYEGILLCELRKQAPGAAAFRAALLLRPDAKLPVQVAPKVEALFESVRKQVKQEIALVLPPGGTEKPSNEAEQEREEPAQPPNNEEPVAVQPLTPPDCAPAQPLAGNSPKEQQLSRLAHMKQALCLSGKFQGLVSDKWMSLKTRMEGTTTSHERTLLSLEIEQFASEFVSDARGVAEQREAERLEAERREAERLDDERQLLLKRLRIAQATFLSTRPPSTLPQLRELLAIANTIRAAHTREQLQEAARAIDSWQQRHVTP